MEDPGGQKKQTILLVEDEVILSMNQTAVLERYGYRVFTANSGEKAVNAVLTTPEIDLVLLDINLGPGIDGPEAARRILAQRDIPIVFLSSHSEPDVVAKTEAITSYGYVVKNSGIAVLDASIKMAFRLFEAKQQISQNERKVNALISNISDVITIIGPDGILKYESPNIEKLFGWRAEELVGTDGWLTVHPDDRPRMEKEFALVLERENTTRTAEFRFLCKDGSYTPVEITAINRLEDPAIRGILLNYHDISARKQVDEILEKRLVALTKPLESESVNFAELFDAGAIQRIQDDFSAATGVASIITDLEGKPITKPSNFTELCFGIIRNTPVGCANCFRSDAALGRHHPEGPIVQQCLSGGLWDAGASITVGGKHVANWLIGQVRDEAQTEEHMRAYARTIGVEEERFIKAFHKVPVMARSRFEQIARALFDLANQIATIAYQNVQQARFIAERRLVNLELNQTNAYLNNLFDYANAPIITWGPDYRITRFNHAFERLTGRNHSEVLGQGLDILFPVETRAASMALIARAAEGERLETVEIPILATSGEIRTVIWNSANVRDPDGKLVSTIAQGVDITERKRGEAEIERNANRLKLLVDILQHPSKSIQEFLDYALNEALELTGSRLGYIYHYNEDRQEFILNTWSKEVMDECRVMDPQTVYQLEKTGIWGEAVRQRRPIVVNDFGMDNPLRKGYPEGHVRLHNFMTLPVIQGGRIIGVVGLANKTGDYDETDVLQVSLMMEAVWKVTERMKAEEALRLSEEKFKQLIWDMQVGVLLQGPGAEILLSNPQALELLGLSEAQLLGMTSFDPSWRVIHEDGTPFPGPEHPVPQAIAGRKPVRNVVMGVFRPALEDMVWLLVDAEPNMTPEGSVQHVVCTFIDITKRKDAEEQISKLVQEKDLILREVHHRIKNNMTTICSLLTLQAEMASEELSRTALKDAANRVQSMQVLYDKLYTGSRFMDLDVSSYLGSLSRDIIANFPNTRNVRLELQLDDFRLEVKKLQPLGIIVNELLTNIMKYAFDMQTGGLIRLTMQRQGNRAVLSVQDNGRGLPAGLDFNNSTGFGLMLIGMLTKQIDGNLRVERTPGTTISIEFPV